MTELVYIVQAHPIENGELNLGKVGAEREFDTKEDADTWMFYCNLFGDGKTGASHHGCRNEATGVSP